MSGTMVESFEDRGIAQKNSGLAQFTKSPDAVMNHGSKRQESSIEIYDEYISESTLKEVSKRDDLRKVSNLDIKLDVNKVSCGNFGSLLPNLRVLKFTCSVIPAIRDLGSSLDRLEVLWMPRCELKSLDGLSGMPNLSELYLSYNGIKDIGPCVMLELLEVLDLEGNIINDRSCLNFLKPCTRLTNLTLEGNPIVNLLGGTKSYRHVVKKSLPQVRILDDVAIENCVSIKMNDPNVLSFENEWDYINALLHEVGLSSEKYPNPSPDLQTGDLQVSDSQTSGHVSEYPIITEQCEKSLRSTTAQQKLTSSDPSTADSAVTQSLPPSDLRPTSSSSLAVEVQDISDVDETTSELTTGKVVCGGIGGALRRRRSSAKLNSSAPRPSLLAANVAGENSPKPSPVDETLRRKLTDAQKLELQNRDPTTRCIFKEEQELKTECEAIFKELAIWRKKCTMKEKSKGKRQDRHQSAISPLDTENDTIILSADSESTLEDRSLSGSRGLLNDVETLDKTSNDAIPEGIQPVGDSKVDQSIESEPSSTEITVHQKSKGIEMSQNSLKHRSKSPFNGSSTTDKSSAHSRITKGSSPRRPAWAQTNAKDRSSPDKILSGRSELVMHTKSAEGRRNPLPSFPQLPKTIPSEKSNHVTITGTRNNTLGDLASPSSRWTSTYRPRLATAVTSEALARKFSMSGGDAQPNTLRPPHGKPKPSLLRLDNDSRTQHKITNSTANLVPSKHPAK